MLQRLVAFPINVINQWLDNTCLHVYTVIILFKNIFPFFYFYNNIYPVKTNSALKQVNIALTNLYIYNELFILFTIFTFWLTIQNMNKIYLSFTFFRTVSSGLHNLSRTGGRNLLSLTSNCSSVSADPTRKNTRSSRAKKHEVLDM